MKKRYVKNFFKVVIFITIFAILLSSVNLTLAIGMDRQSYDPIRGFYDEPAESLDAVYIGSSNTLAFWNPLIAWQEYGITVYSFAGNALPLASTEFVIKEVRKTQPDTKFIVNINGIADVPDPVGLYRVFDYTPFSLNKMYYINSVCDLYDFSLEEKMNYYFPIIQFHDRWRLLEANDFNFEAQDYKGSFTYEKYISRVRNLSKVYITTDKRVELSEMLDVSMTRLLDYCDKENLDVIFVNVPQAKDEETVAKYNSVCDMVEKRGYPVLRLLDKTRELDISLEKDFYNSKHTNIHGSLKFTHYLADYLIDTWDLKDKRGEEEYNHWDQELEDYLTKIKHGAMEFEFSPDYDCSILNEPEHLTAVATTDEISVSWEAIEGADGYAVYRRKGKTGSWTEMAQIDEPEFTDTDYENKKVYYYRVVPFKNNGEKVAYGDFSYQGVSVTAKKK